jgi:hypothetical protein
MFITKEDKNELKAWLNQVCKSYQYLKSHSISIQSNPWKLKKINFWSSEGKPSVAESFLSTKFMDDDDHS